MANTHPVELGDVENVEPLSYPCCDLSMNAPMRWLRLGWQAIKQAPGSSLVYGFGLVIFFDVATWLFWDGENTMALFTLAVAFILAGSALAFGLYSISRQLEQGMAPRLGMCWRESGNHMRNELLFALVMLVVLLVWARAASMVHVFFPIGDDIQLIDWLQFLAVGNTVGSIFATIVFCASVVALPMMLGRGTDAITSVNAGVQK